MQIINITPSLIQQFLNTQGKVYSLETLKKMKSCLKNILQLAKDEQIIFVNPVTSRVKLKSEIPPQPKNIWSKQHYDLAFNFALTHKDGLGPLILMDIGISRSELLGIMWKNINWDQKYIQIYQGTVPMQDPISHKYYVFTGGLKNQYRKREIPISNKVCEKLKLEYQRVLFLGKQQGLSQKQINNQFIIPNKYGKAMDPNNWGQRSYKRFINDLTAKYPQVPKLTPHELRHTRATLWYEEQIDLLAIGFAGGWCDLKMLRKRYAHINIDILKKKLNRI